MHTCSCSPNGACLEKNIIPQNGVCEQDFQCIENYLCAGGKCQADCENPPPGMQCCGKTFKRTSFLSIGSSCGCDFECSESTCYDNKCQLLIDPKITCTNRAKVQLNETLTCTIYAANSVYENSKLTLTTESTISFISGCDTIVGNKCTIDSFEEQGTDIQIKGNRFGNYKIEGQVSFPFGLKKVTETLQTTDFETIKVIGCGNALQDLGETKETCCIDVPVKENTFFQKYDEFCDNGKYIEKISYNILLFLFL